MVPPVAIWRGSRVGISKLLAILRLPPLVGWEAFDKDSDLKKLLLRICCGVNLLNCMGGITGLVIEDVSVVISDWVTGVATLSGVEAAVVGVVSISAFCGILGVDIT